MGTNNTTGKTWNISSYMAKRVRIKAGFLIETAEGERLVEQTSLASTTVSTSGVDNRDMVLKPLESI